jgi:hypothetical protein
MEQKTRVFCQPDVQEFYLRDIDFNTAGKQALTEKGWAANLFFLSANYESTNSWAHSAIANPQMT